MTIIRPYADLKNNYNEISKIREETKQSIMIETDEEKIDRLVSEEFDKHYATFEEFRSDFFRHIEQAHREIEEGKYQSIEEFCSEMEGKYEFTKQYPV